jgi:hypothetical protein
MSSTCKILKHFFSFFVLQKKRCAKRIKRMKKQIHQKVFYEVNCGKFEKFLIVFLTINGRVFQKSATKSNKEAKKFDTFRD